ncbi:MAG: hypothetical protein ACOH2T_27320, partial [Pseudomonas sp.]
GQFYFGRVGQFSTGVDSYRQKKGQKRSTCVHETSGDSSFQLLSSAAWNILAPHNQPPRSELNDGF